MLTDPVTLAFVVGGISIVYVTVLVLAAAWHGEFGRHAPRPPRVPVAASPLLHAPSPELDSFEYQRFYDTGELPERCFDREAAKAKAEYLADRITLAELERELDPDGFILDKGDSIG